jgi:GAF domain-containing protein
VSATTTTIDRGQREGLYELVRNHLGGIEDFFVALERTEDFAKAEQLAVEFAEDFRLLQDIGWGRKDEREAFDLTMPAADLLELLTRLHGEAVKVLVESGSEAQSSREDAETDRRLQLGYEACNKLLAGLDPREEGSGRPPRPVSRRSRSSCPHGDTP